MFQTKMTISRVRTRNRKIIAFVHVRGKLKHAHAQKTIVIDQHNGDRLKLQISY